MILIGSTSTYKCLSFQPTNVILVQKRHIPTISTAIVSTFTPKWGEEDGRPVSSLRDSFVKSDWMTSTDIQFGIQWRMTSWNMLVNFLGKKPQGVSPKLTLVWSVFCTWKYRRLAGNQWISMVPIFLNISHVQHGLIHRSTVIWAKIEKPQWTSMKIWNCMKNRRIFCLLDLEQWNHIACAYCTYIRTCVLCSQASLARGHKTPTTSALDSTISASICLLLHDMYIIVKLYIIYIRIQICLLA